MTCSESGALPLINDYGFDGVEGEPPDDDLWNLRLTDDDEYVIIEDGMLRCHSTGNGYAAVSCTRNFTQNNVTFLLDFKINIHDGRSLDMRIATKHEGVYKRWVMFGYDANTYGWVPAYYVDGEWQDPWSYDNDAKSGVWYTANVTVEWDVVQISVTERDTGRVLHKIEDLKVDPLLGDNRIYIGVYQFHKSGNSDTVYDNLRLIPLDLPDNVPPYWDPVPAIEGVEGEPFTFDFSPFAHDPDSGPGRLQLTCDSPNIASIDGLSCTFLFDEGDVDRTLRLRLSDGLDTADSDVSFVIEPVNDPPTVHFIVPKEQTYILVGETLTIVLEAIDPDLGPEESLDLAIDSNRSGHLYGRPCIGKVELTVDDLGMGDHKITASVTDGEHEADDWIVIHVVTELPPDPRCRVDSVYLTLILIVVVVFSLVTIEEWKRTR
jgi:hypothetical protein